MSRDEKLRAAANEAVRRASVLTRTVQQNLTAVDASNKADDSPVTVADFGAQAVVAITLRELLGDDRIMGEESATELASSGVTDAVATEVGAVLGRTVSAADVVEAISTAPSIDRDEYWVLDPVDGTKGFLRGDQYAIALALVRDGAVVLGVLGCPNYPIGSGRGATFIADMDGTEEVSAGSSAKLRTVAPESIAETRLCESVERGHSDHGAAAEIMARLQIGAEPFRIDSQCKYGAVARNDAHVYLRLPTRSDYVEKAWDHAAGSFVVEQAGGTVTDVDGAALDFSTGATLTRNRGVVASSGRDHRAVLDAVRSVLAAR